MRVRWYLVNDRATTCFHHVPWAQGVSTEISLEWAEMSDISRLMSDRCSATQLWALGRDRSTWLESNEPTNERRLLRWWRLVKTDLQIYIRHSSLAPVVRVLPCIISMPCLRLGSCLSVVIAARHPSWLRYKHSYLPRLRCHLWLSTDGRSTTVMLMWPFITPYGVPFALQYQLYYKVLYGNRNCSDVTEATSGTSLTDTCSY